MIVAAGALHPDAEQCLRDDTGHLQRVGIFGGEVADGAIVARSAHGREQLPHDLVVGLAVAHASSQELVELRATGRAGTHAQHVADPDRPAIGETVARDQSSNEPVAAHGGRLRSVEPAFGDGGNPADEIDRDPPEVSRVVDQGSRGELLCLPRCGEQLIDPPARQRGIVASGDDRHAIVRPAGRRCNGICRAGARGGHGHGHEHDPSQTVNGMVCQPVVGDG